MIRDIHPDPNLVDWSINLPSWACREGWALKGKCGTYDSLELWKNWDLVKSFPWNKIPNIFEIEDIIKEEESN